MNSAPPAIGMHVYQALLLLYPSAFRLEFGGEMASDFDEATGDAWRHRRWIGVWAFWALVGADLARTVVVQWLRTGLPALILLSGMWSTMMCTLIAKQFVPRSPAVALIPPKSPNDEVLILLIGAAVLVVVIAATILVTGWFWMLVLKRKRRA